MGARMGARIGANLGTETGREAAFRLGHRYCRPNPAGGAELCAEFDVSIFADGAWRAGPAAEAELRAAARFLLDTAYGVVEPRELARMIGCFAFASAAAAGQTERDGALDVALRNDRGLITAARLRPPVFAVERNGFGTAHVLFETAALGLYVLEVAPGAEIPAHYHRVMREDELVLDDGLLQQRRPVRAGDAFTWPAGLVHEYRNPTGAPKRILCIDRPKFIPDDEVVVAGAAELLPVAPVRTYRD